jgi:hypothetical protein
MVGSLHSYPTFGNNLFVNDFSLIYLKWRGVWCLFPLGFLLMDSSFGLGQLQLSWAPTELKENSMA